MKSLLREPLVHFLAIGAAIFVVYAVMNPPSEEAVTENTIVIDADTAARLAAQYQQVWRRPPSVEELDKLIAAYLREEVLVREALSLSMDQDDAVIRQRLAQKMTFLLDASAAAESPDDETLQGFFEEYAANYQRPGQVAFEQVFLGQSPSEDDIANARAALDDGRTPQTPRSLLPPTVPLATQTAIDGRLGSGVYDRLGDLPQGVWAGPVESGYGLHLVRITERVEPQTPPFDALKPRLEADWRAVRAQELAEEVYRGLLAGYDVTRPDPSDLAPLTQ